MQDQRPDTDWAARLAFVISAAGSPFVVLPFFIILLIHTHAPGPEAWLYSAVVVAGIVGAPLLYVIVGVTQGSITDLHVQLREQRTGPFIAALLGAVLAAVGLALVDAPFPLQLAAMAVVANEILFFLITLRWKISIHPATLASSLVLATLLISPAWAWCGLTLPAVMWARVRRQRHSWSQTVAATVLAGIVTALMVLIYFQIVPPSIDLR